jgi:membrane protein implicated in regulation of membrane protease activity
MEPSIVWLIAGIALVVAEMMLGTFYLLVLGFAAGIAALVAHLGGAFLTQVLLAAGIAIAGVLWLRAHGGAGRTPEMAPLDVGQSVTLDRWVNREDGTARVRYRDALWDAVVEGEVRGEPGEMLYIHAVDGSTLHVARRKAATR